MRLIDPQIQSQQPKRKRLLRRKRKGLSKLSVVAILSLITMIGLGFAALQLRPDARPAKQTGRTETVQIYCASGLVQSVEAIAARYNESHDATVSIVRAG